MRKIVLWIVVIVVLLPVAAFLAPVIRDMMPEPVTVDRVEAAFRDAGYWVEDVVEQTPPFLDAAEQVNMRVDGYRVMVMRFGDEGKIVRYLEYAKPDAGSVIVEAWNLSESLGAAKPKNIPSTSARNGMWAITVTSENPDLRRRLVSIFKDL